MPCSHPRIRRFRTSCAATALASILAAGCASPGPVDAVVLPVGDLDRAAAFYGALLDDAGTRESGERHRFGRTAALICALPDAGSAPTQSPVILRCHDLDRAEAAAHARGGITIARDRARGTIELRDPFGNRVTLTR